MTGGKVIKNRAISQRTVWYFFVDVNKQIQYKTKIARSSKVSDGPGGKLVEFAGTQLLDFNSGRWEHQSSISLDALPFPEEHLSSHF